MKIKELKEVEVSLVISISLFIMAMVILVFDTPISFNLIGLSLCVINLFFILNSSKDKKQKREVETIVLLEEKYKDSLKSITREVREGETENKTFFVVETEDGYINRYTTENSESTPIFSSREKIKKMDGE